jgi:hypothetical protein
VFITGADHWKARDNVTLTFQYMFKKPSLRDWLYDKSKQQEFPYWEEAKKYLVSNLSNNGINCQSGKEANDNIHFTTPYADSEFLVPDNLANRTRIIFSPLLQQALKSLKQASKSELAQPCVRVEVQRGVSTVGFALTVSLWFFNPNRRV